MRNSEWNILCLIPTVEINNRCLIPDRIELLHNTNSRENEGQRLVTVCKARNTAFLMDLMYLVLPAGVLGWTPSRDHESIG